MVLVVQAVLDDLRRTDKDHVEARGDAGEILDVGRIRVRFVEVAESGQRRAADASAGRDDHRVQNRVGPRRPHFPAPASHSFCHVLVRDQAGAGREARGLSNGGERARSDAVVVVNDADPVARGGVQAGVPRLTMPWLVSCTMTCSVRSDAPAEPDSSRDASSTTISSSPSFSWATMAASNSARLADRLYDGTVMLIDGSDIEGSNRAAEIIRDLLQPPARRPDLVRQRAPALACELALAMPECGDRDGMERRDMWKYPNVRSTKPSPSAASPGVVVDWPPARKTATIIPR